MKKFFFCAAAAIVALASCSKTEVVNTSAPEEIGFKAVTGAVTKVAGQQSGTLTGDMGVYAFINGTADTEYFTNIKFTGTDTWTGGQYWPLQSSLNFVIYAPHDANASYSTKKLTVEATNVGIDLIDRQTDYLYGAEYYDGSGNDEGKGYATQQTAIATKLNHALAKVTLKFTGANVKVNSVSLEQPYLSGTYTVDYTDTDSPTIEWDAIQEANNLTLSGIRDAVLAPAVLDDPETLDRDETADEQTASASIMVVPEDDSNIIITYTIAGTDDVLTATVKLDGTWAAGKHYTYNIKIQPNEIKFTPSVNDWTTANDVNTTL